MLNFNFINTKNDERRSRKFSGELGLNDTQGKQISIMKESDLEENELNTNSRYKMSIRKEEENNDKFNNSVGMSLVSDRMFRETLNSTEEPRKQQQILTYGTYLKYKIFKCCVKNQKKLYTNYKWIMDVNYLLKIYIQIHFLKTIFLSKKQVQLLDTISLLEKINVNSKFNIKMIIL